MSKRNSRHHGTEQYQFTNYLSFGPITTICIGMYLLVYLIIIILFSPLLIQQSPSDNEYDNVQDFKPGFVLKPVFNNMKQKFHDFEKNSDNNNINNNDTKGSGVAHALRKIAEKEVAILKKKFHNFRIESNISDTILLENAMNEMNQRRKVRTDKQQQLKQNNPTDTQIKNNNKIRNGFIVLGMHRSGTSMLSGLLVKGLGYNVGGPLIGSSFDNKKGFFELLPVVLQNDEFFYLQNMYWASGIALYNTTVALQQYYTGQVKFVRGTNALNFLNANTSIPYLQKDPRMCITLQTWLPLLNHEPAIVFTYRHPVEVAMSIHTREKDISISQALRIWIVYNRRAIENSKGLCIVYTSNVAVISNPFTEVQRISNELTNKCNVPKPSNTLSQELVDTFVDKKLQHGSTTGGSTNNKNVTNTAAMKVSTKKIIATVGNDCIIYELITKTIKNTPEHKYEQLLYSAAMKIYCDLQSGDAHTSYYTWADLDMYDEYPTNDEETNTDDTAEEEQQPDADTAAAAAAEGEEEEHEASEKEKVQPGEENVKDNAAADETAEEVK